ncbi:MAG: thiamine phosphate synthase [Gemmatimonadota bacterium]
MPDNLTTALRLVLVTDDDLVAGRDLGVLARAAVAGGVTAIQLRLKRTDPRQLMRILLQLRDSVSVPLFINDRPDIAAAAGVGVHLGPEDLSPASARLVLGPSAVIGASVGSAAEVEGGQAADYWGIGPWRTTPTKSDAGAALGAAEFATLAGFAGSRPRIAIGGVRPEDAAEIVAAGGTGIAVASGILGARDIGRASRSYADAIAAALSS